MIHRILNRIKIDSSFCFQKTTSYNPVDLILIQEHRINILPFSIEFRFNNSYKSWIHPIIKNSFFQNLHIHSFVQLMLPKIQIFNLTKMENSSVFLNYTQNREIEQNNKQQLDSFIENNSEDKNKMSEEKSFYSFSAKRRDGSETSMSDFKGNVVLVVNTASQCGLTKSNYTQLQELQDKYYSEGLRILAFPCNQFAGVCIFG